MRIFISLFLTTLLVYSFFMFIFTVITGNTMILGFSIGINLGILIVSFLESKSLKQRNQKGGAHDKIHKRNG